jgi:hypothetical protein
VKNLIYKLGDYPFIIIVLSVLLMIPGMPKSMQLIILFLIIILVGYNIVYYIGLFANKVSIWNKKKRFLETLLYWFQQKKEEEIVELR